MIRAAILLATILALAWQSFAAVAATLLPGGRTDVVHSVMHWQEIPHHHGHRHASSDEGHHHDHSHDHGLPGDGEGMPAGHHEGDEAPAPAAPGVATTFHVDDSGDSLAHLASDHCSPPTLLCAEFAPPLAPGGLRPEPAREIAKPLLVPGGLFRPPRAIA